MPNVIGPKYLEDVRRLAAEALLRASAALSIPSTVPGVELIRSERIRQAAEEGWTVEHDDQHSGGELASAAACYARPVGHLDPRIGTPTGWPIDWGLQHWKPTYDYRTQRGLNNALQRAARLRDLVKAGALIAAEIDRIQRLRQVCGDGQEETPEVAL